MDVTPLVPAGAQIIQSYAGGRFRVSGTVHNGATIVFPDRTDAWGAADFGTLNIDDFAPLIAAASDLDVVLLGSGAAQGQLSPSLRNALSAAGLHVESMDTGAACRTYNVLMAEGRRVAAALLPV